MWKSFFLGIGVQIQLAVAPIQIVHDHFCPFADGSHVAVRVPTHKTSNPVLVLIRIIVAPVLFGVELSQRIVERFDEPVSNVGLRDVYNEKSTALSETNF